MISASELARKFIAAVRAVSRPRLIELEAPDLDVAHVAAEPLGPLEAEVRPPAVDRMSPPPYVGRWRRIRDLVSYAAALIDNFQMEVMTHGPEVMGEGVRQGACHVPSYPPRLARARTARAMSAAF